MASFLKAGFCPRVRSTRLGPAFSRVNRNGIRMSLRSFLRFFIETPLGTEHEPINQLIKIFKDEVDIRSIGDTADGTDDLLAMGFRGG